MRKLLIADSNEEFRLALAESLQQYFHVLSCGSGLLALDLLRSEKPDFLLLDLMLPELDGITLLETAQREDLHPVTMIASGMLNDYVYTCMARLKIGYMIRKPCSISSLVTRILDLSQGPMPQSKAEDQQSQLRKLLLAFSINVKHNGYSYMMDAIPMILKQPNISMTKELYPEVAKRHGCHWRHVERSIRSSLESAWDRRDADVWDRFFPGAQKRPSNSEFLIRLAQQLQLESE